MTHEETNNMNPAIIQDQLVAMWEERIGVLEGIAVESQKAANLSYDLMDQAYSTLVPNGDIPQDRFWLKVAERVEQLRAERDKLKQLDYDDLIGKGAPCENHQNMNAGGVCGGCLLVARARDAEAQIENRNEELGSVIRDQAQQLTALRADRDVLKRANSDLAAAAIVPDGCVVMVGAKVAETEQQLAALKAALSDLLDIIAADDLIPESVSYIKRARALLAAGGEGEELLRAGIDFPKVKDG